MKFKMIIAVFLCLSSVHSHAQEKLISAGHPQYPPFSYTAGETSKGVGPDLVTAIFAELNIEVEFKQAPWARALKECEHGKIDVINGGYFSDERAKYMDYTIPYMEDQISVYTMKDKVFKFEDWKDLIGKQGVTIRKESFGNEFNNYVKEKLNVHRVNDLERAFIMLTNNRVDYVVFGKYPAIHKMITMGIREKITILEKSVVVENVYVSISQKSKFRKLLPKINAIIKKLLSNGTFEKIKIKNEEEYYEAIKKKLKKDK